MSGYAAETTVDPSKTRGEIEATLKRYGADKFVSGWDEGRAVVGFRCKDRLVRFELHLPARTEKRFLRDGRGSIRSPAAIDREYEQAIRSLWRRLLLCIKAKLEAVNSGIETFEEAFLAHIVLPGNETVSEWLGPQLQAAYTSGTMPQSLLALPPASREDKPP